MFDSTVTKSGRKTVVVTAGRALRTVLWVRTVLLAALVALGLFALAPAAFGWIPTVVTTGSMTPVIRPGDVVVAAPLRASGAVTVRPGSVVLAEDPAKPGTLLLHRVVRRNPDGALVTKGDANPVEDSTPMPPGNLRGVARFTVPMVGVPLLRARAGDPVPAGALVVIVVTLAAVRRPRRSGRHSTVS
ncbi:MAG TPA: signal peptidase I [Candidatus Nitrosopolaris sp.]|nr:signal peptidase I [Candidatus Nitrosopolaris sp.]